jgi:micrococcal nuclease
MPSRALTNPPRSFDDLVRQVRDALINGQADVDRTYLETYRRTGLLIDAHLLYHRERADYGAQVVPRLAEALGLSDRLLYRCLRFVREYPILTGRSELGWAHYRVLIEVPDKAKRKELEAAARKHRWKAEELERRVRALNAIDVTPSKAKLDAGSASAIKPLAPKRGTVGVWRVVAAGTGLAVDLGFTSYVDLPAPTRLQEGAFVQLDAAGQFVARPDASKADLYTYRAEVLRVVDGDTLWMRIYLEPGRWVREKLRLRGLDCPELPTPEGRAAKRFVETFVAKAQAVTITTFKPDKYDRYLADVFIERARGDGPEAKDDEEVFLNNELLAAGHAVRKDEYALTDWGE